MKRVTPRQKIRQTLILSKLLEGSMRRMELRQAMEAEIKSDDTFEKDLNALVKQGMVKKEKQSRKHVTYAINESAEEEHKEDFSMARYLSLLGSTEFIAETMNILADYSPTHIENDCWIFSSQEERVQAAIDFWVERYRNLSVLNALFSLQEEDQRKSALDLRKLYRATEDKYFDIILRFKRKHPDIFKTVLDRKLSLKGVDLRPSWVSMRLDGFLKAYYPEAYEKLSDGDKASIYFSLLAKQRQTEYINCSKNNKEYPRWVCKSCKLFKISKDKKRCKYQKIPSVRERIANINKRNNIAKLIRRS